MFTLIGLGVSVAYLFSAVAALVPGIFLASFRHAGAVAVGSEAAGVVVSGEPVPVQKQPSEQVVGATIHGAGTLVTRTEKVGVDSLVENPPQGSSPCVLPAV